MKGVASIAHGDFHTIRTNAMTRVIVFGLSVIPLMFAGFNILASWNPFANTNQLKIAVASADQGEKLDLANVNVNLGDSVLSQLARNESFDWVITDQNNAIEGTKSGQFYASIIIPENFSQELLNFYVQGTQPPELTLHTNEKKNALSSLITSKGASGVIQEIDRKFSEITASVGMGAVTSINTEIQNSNSERTIGQVQSRVSDTATQLRAGAQTARSLQGLVDTTIPLVEGANNILGAAGSQISNASSPGGQAAASTDQLGQSITDAQNSVDSALAQTEGSYKAVGDQLAQLGGNAQATANSGADTLDTLSRQVQAQADHLKDLRNRILNITHGTVPGPAQPPYDKAMSDLDTAVAKTEGLASQLHAHAEALRAGLKPDPALEQSAAAAGAAVAAVQSARQSFQTTLKPALGNMAASLDTLRKDAAQIGQNLQSAQGDLTSSPNSVEGTLMHSRDTVGSLAQRFDNLAGRFDQLNAALEDAKKSGDLSKVAAIIGPDPQGLANRMASPVRVQEDPIYPVAAFGAGMAPFYSVLSLWIGALLTSVIMRTRVHVPRGQVDRYNRVQKYFGRFLTFAAVGLAQSTLLMLGLVIFVQLRPAHPFLLFVVGWVTSLVFMTIMYSLVLTFDNAGKALAVVLLIFQVSAAGGAYPLPMVPHWFQMISPWLPATYAVDATRSAIAGVYKGGIWQQLGMLALFIPPSLVLGLVLKPLIEKGVNKMARAMEETKVMATS